MTSPATTPDHPGQLEKRSWIAVAKRTVKEFREDNLTDWAAALTYYAVLAIFPALIVIVSLLGLIGESATDPLIENLGDVAPGPAQEIFTNAITDLQENQGAAGFAFVIGLAVALWSASGYIGRVHARVERDLRDRGGPADLEERPRSRGRDARRSSSAPSSALWRSCSPAGWPRRSAT